MSNFDKELKLGSLAVSEKAHSFLVSCVFSEDEPFEDAPFDSIVEAFRFAFALGYSKKFDKKANWRN